MTPQTNTGNPAQLLFHTLVSAQVITPQVETDNERKLLALAFWLQEFRLTPTQIILACQELAEMFDERKESQSETSDPITVSCLRTLAPPAGVTVQLEFPDYGNVFQPELNTWADRPENVLVTTTIDLDQAMTIYARPESK